MHKQKHRGPQASPLILGKAILKHFLCLPGWPGAEMAWRRYRGQSWIPAPQTPNRYKHT